jgi:hypothetical protein
MDRRHFLMSSAAAFGAASSVFGSPSDTVRVACVGIGGRSKDHINSYSKLANVEIVAICDPDDSHIANGLNQISKLGKPAPTTYKDIRKLLEDKNIDAISISSPNHWHTLMAIWAMQAGKDVYVEKPCSHNIFEAKQIVAAARKYDKIVQQGSQIRSSKAVQEAVKSMRDGLIGDVYLSRGLCFKWRDTIGRKPVEPVPAGVDYDLWTGPSPMHEWSFYVRRRPGNAQHPQRGLRVQRGRQAQNAGIRSAPLDVEWRSHRGGQGTQRDRQSVLRVEGLPGGR